MFLSKRKVIFLTSIFLLVFFLTINDIKSQELKVVDGDTIYYSLVSADGGPDSNLLSISSSGLITFKTTPDYENPADADSNNRYSFYVCISSSDNSGNSTCNGTAYLWHGNVSNINESPSFTSSASFNVAENQTTIGTVEAADPESATLTY